MRPLALSQLADWCDARLVGEDRRVASIAIDSRAVQADGLFVALVGERHDGHDHAAAALASGAAAVLCERPLDIAAPQVVCGSTRAALGRIAAGLAATRETRIVAITGSNGKTTVKTLTHAILSRMGQGTDGSAPSTDGPDRAAAGTTKTPSTVGRHYRADAGTTSAPRVGTVVPTYKSGSNPAAAAAPAATAYANPGNRNNEIGLPLALIEQPEDAAFGIYEMGAGQPGDIAYLTDIARPDIALVNNVAAAHLERMGSLLGVAETKGAIYAALHAGGTAVLNADDAFATWFEALLAGAPRHRADAPAAHARTDTPAGHARTDTPAHARTDAPAGHARSHTSANSVVPPAGARHAGDGRGEAAATTGIAAASPPPQQTHGGTRILRFALEASADIYPEDLHCGADASRFTLVTPSGRAAVTLPLPGRHNVANALAAAALALAAGATLEQVAQGLAAAPAVAGRLASHALANGAVLIDDSYNANPGSVAAAISTLTAHAAAGRTPWLVLGDMRELGTDAGRLHAEAGARAREAGIAQLFTVGPLSAAASRAFGVGAQHFEDQDRLLAALRAALLSQAAARVACLVKGSRSSAMERIVAALLDAAASDRHMGSPGHVA